MVRKLLIYIDCIKRINKWKYKKVRIVIPVVVGSSPISHPKIQSLLHCRARQKSPSSRGFFFGRCGLQFTITSLPLTPRDPMWA
jgi:hypothetical protein